MKWLAIAGVLLYLTRHGDAAAVKCSPDSQDPSCASVERHLSSLKNVHREAECLAGSEWESNCHKCWCSDAGVAECVKQEACDLAVYKEPIKCKPKTTFRRDCDWCLCLDNGHGLCTLTKCKDLTELNPTQNEQKDRRTSLKYVHREAECLAGSEWESNCHKCWCSDAGVAECVKQEACDLAVYKEPIKCKPKTTFRRDCDWCLCLDNGHGLCTLTKCKDLTELNPTQNEQKDRRKRQAGGFVRQECEPDTTWKEDCNTCRCMNGVATCTRRGCLPSHGSEEARLQKRDTTSAGNIQNHVITKRGVCKSHTEFQIDCNPCKCAANGQSYTCTHNECLEGSDTNKEVEVFMESEGSDHIERHSICAPRDIFYIGCNPCHCNTSGTDYTCTNKPCPLPKDVEIFHELNWGHLQVDKSKSNSTKPKVVCVANRMFIMDCNTCWCNEDGTSFFCTRRVCTPDDTSSTDEPEFPPEVSNLREVKKECRPNEVFELDCNMCRCSPDGKSFSCTRRACAPEIQDNDKNAALIRKSRAVQQEASKTCQPGVEFRMDCNKCLCNDEGLDFSCTRIDCAAQNGNGEVDSFAGTRSKREVEQVEMKCIPDSVFDRGCNVCRCTAEGLHAVCSLKPCRNQEKDESPVTTDPNFRCTPGDQFKRECNDCTCSADGKNVFCTLRLCDIELDGVV